MCSPHTISDVVFKKYHSEQNYFSWILWNHNTFLNHTICSLLAGGKSGEMLFFYIWPWEVKGHLKVMHNKLLDSDKRSDYPVFGENRRFLSWLEQELCPLEDKMLSRISWPKMTSISDLRGHNGLKVGIWGLFAMGSVWAKFERNQKWSMLFLIDLTLNDPKGTWIPIRVCR